MTDSVARAATKRVLSEKRILRVVFARSGVKVDEVVRDKSQECKHNVEDESGRKLMGG